MDQINNRFFLKFDAQTKMKFTIIFLHAHVNHYML
jgi:hypothetical protein